MSESHLSRDQSNTVGTASLLSKTARAGYVVNEAVGTSSSIPSKRKNGVLFSKRKCLKVDNADLLELMVTLEEAQGLFRAPADHAPNIVIIEDVVFEEYEVLHCNCYIIYGLTVFYIVFILLFKIFLMKFAGR